MGEAFRGDEAVILQGIFREVMDAFTFPLRTGRIRAEEAAPLLQGEENAALKALCLTFLDGGVSYYVDGGAKLAEEIGELTGAKAAALEEADYVIAEARVCPALLGSIRQGTLVDPHKGATVIVLTEEIDGAANVTAEGPGVKGRQSFRLSGEAARVLGERALLEWEYPRGFELLFLTRQGDFIAVPRRVTVSQEGI